MPSIDSLLKRAFVFLEDGDWNSADKHCKKLLDIHVENELAALLGELQQAADDGDDDSVKALCVNTAAHTERNRLCKLNK